MRSEDLIIIGKHDRAVIGLHLPTLIESRLLVQANSGGGKSWLLRRLLEQSHGKVQQIVIDLEGEFNTLREKFDYILCGKGGDTPAQPKTASLLARRLMEVGVSAICDLSELHKEERPRFVRLFLEQLVELPKASRHPVLILIDECHQFCPETGKAESADAVIDLCTRGRKRGLCAVLATQRIAKLSKDASAETLNRLVGRTGQDIDQLRAGDELGMNKADRLLLRNLRPGDFHIFGPALYVDRQSFGGISSIHVGAVTTKHPTVGSREIEAPVVSTPAIKAALAKLVDLPGEAEREAKNLETMRRENIDLKRQLVAAQKTTPAAPCGHEEQIEELQREVTRLTVAWGPVQMQIECSIRAIKHSMEHFIKQGSFAIGAELDNLDTFVKTNRVSRVGSIGDPIKFTVPPGTPLGRVGGPYVPASKIKPSVTAQDTDVPRSHQRLLDGLAWFAAFGQETVSQQALAGLCGMSWSGGAFQKYRSALKTSGYIDYRNGTLLLTEAGRAVANFPEEAPTLSSLHDSWLSVFPNSHKKILSVLIEAYPRALTQQEVAAAVEMESSGGAFQKYRSKLKTMGAIDYIEGRLIASALLFPEGLQ